MPEKSVQEQLDTQIAAQQKKKQKVKVVESSAAPVLSAELVKEKGKKTYTVECLIDDTVFQIEVLRGVPFHISVMLRKTAEIYALRQRTTDAADAEDVPDATDATIDEETEQQVSEEDRHIKRLLVSSLVVQTDADTGQIVPVFSYNGFGGSIDIEAQSDIFLSVLYDAVMEVQVPEGSADALDRFHGVGEQHGSGADDGA